MTEILKYVGKQFRLAGELESYESIKNGNINVTYKVSYRRADGSLKSYIFQKINTRVFKKPADIMRNIDLVTTHIRKKYTEIPTLHFHHTTSGENYLYDGDGSFWRVMNYIDSITFNSCDDLEVVRNTGLAFGRFQMQLADFDGSQLYETIPNFHNTRMRIDALLENAEKDPVGRVSEVREDLEYIASVREKAIELSEKFYNGTIPVRVTHNDTKCNNVLFDRVTKLPIIIIDLDTVMPGMSMYDFGDAARFIANTGVEDEEDLNKVSFSIEAFRALAEGYIGELAGHVTDEEILSLPLATFSITVELASRFLDDYITGDTYFKTLYPKHNLVRTRCQLRLAQSIMEQYDDLCRIVNELYNK
ncbi:MAG: aminoglycoside phosphotransferase family protein [Clostridia bacterium]|nr:aminoglycoside phosphotransferase family protein [Clostridia bacterium]